jgi:two-component system, chemotaxis family, CheB/CheR fusion protein
VIEEHKTLIANELQHRTQNLIAVIGSIAKRTLTGDRPLEESRGAFSARLQALAKAHALFTPEGGQAAPLGDIVRAGLAIFSDRVEIKGPRVLLTPSATQAFALIIHELATNAVKYGALADRGGKVAVTWFQMDGAGKEPRFSFRWQERGGLPVKPPTHKGFGSTLLERAMNSARAQFDYAPEGLTYELDVALASICDKLHRGQTTRNEGKSR